jgi:hypothetical protein
MELLQGETVEEVLERHQRHVEKTRSSKVYSNPNSEQNCDVPPVVYSYKWIYNLQILRPE